MSKDSTVRKLESVGSIPSSGGAVLVTPTMAEGWLASNYEGQRRINRSRVDEYKRMILAGQWTLTHQGVAFNSAGQLVDGQHRLHAIKESGVPVRMFVFHGVDAFDVIDTHGVRDMAAVLGTTKVEASAYGWIYRLETGLLMMGRVTPVETAPTMKRHSAVLERLRVPAATPGASSGSASRYLTGVVLASCAFAYPLDQDAVVQFVEHVARGEMLKIGEPAYTFRNWIDSTRTSHPHRYQVAYAACTALNAHISSTPLRMIKLSAAGYAAICARRRRLGIAPTPSDGAAQTSAEKRAKKERP